MTSSTSTTADPRPQNPTEAWAALAAGNARFMAEEQKHPHQDVHARSMLAAEQKPFAIFFGCADSRVAAEIIFDQGLGDLFVIRVAGTIIAPSLVGSVEFAAARFGTPLVVVLGHTQCGGIMATIEELESPGATPSRNLQSIVNRIRPSVQGLFDAGLRGDALVKQAVRANIRASANHLRHGSRILETLIADKGMRVVGAEYSLETGVVDFFDGV
jgi:carbonic anhydrase